MITMLKIKIDTEKAVKKLKRMPQNLNKAIASTSDNIKYDVYETTRVYAPHWRNVLRSSVLTESYDFVETPLGMRQQLVYDAWNPRTNFHYAQLRHFDNKTGIKGWAIIGSEIATPLIEKEIIQAVNKGVGK